MRWWWCGWGVPSRGDCCRDACKLKSSLVCVYTYSRYNMCNHVQPLSRQPHRKILSTVGNCFFMCAETSTHFIPLSTQKIKILKQLGYGAKGFQNSRKDLCNVT